MTAAECEAEGVEHLTTLTKGGQRALEPVLREYLMRIDWREGWPAEWRPREDVVKLNPEIVFGLPNVRGIRTEVLRSRFLGNDSVDVIADDSGLAVHEVEAALRYELWLEQAA